MFMVRGTIYADRLELWLSYMIGLRVVVCDRPCIVGLGLEVLFRLAG